MTPKIQPIFSKYSINACRIDEAVRKNKDKKHCLGLSLSHIQLSFPFFLLLCLFFLNEHWNKSGKWKELWGAWRGPSCLRKKGRAEITVSGGHSDNKAAGFPESLRFFSLAVALS